MKKYTFSVILFFIIILLATTFISCESSVDEEVTPNTSQDSTLFPIITADDTITIYRVSNPALIRYKVQAQDKIRNITFSVKGRVQSSLNISRNNYTGQFEYEASLTDTATTVPCLIIATDSIGRKTTKKIIIDVKGHKRWFEHPGLYIGTLGNGLDIGSFLSIRRFRTYTLSEAKANISKIDLVYFEPSRSSGEWNVLASLTDTLAGMVFNDSTSGLQTWDSTQIRRTILRETEIESNTLLYLDNGYQLVEAFEKGKPIYSSGSPFDLENIGTRVKRLRAGHKIAFKTADDHYGVIYIDDVIDLDTNTLDDIPKKGTIKIRLYSTL